MIKSPLARLLFVVSSWLCAIAALNIGLVGLLGGRNLLHELLGKLRMFALITPLDYLFGIAGLIFIAMLIMDAMYPGCYIKE